MGGNYNAAGPQVLRFCWDGRESILSVEVAPTEPLCGPGPWKSVLTRPFANSEAAQQFVETYALKWWRSG